MKHTRPLTLAAVLAAVVGAAGCSSQSGHSAAPSESASASTPDLSQETPAVEEPPAKFGRKFYYPTGLNVMVSPPSKYVPSATAALEPGLKAFVQFTVTVTNRGTASYAPSGLNVSAQSADTEAFPVFDSEKNMLSPSLISTPVLPGRSLSIKVAFGVADPADIVVSVVPSTDYGPAIFKS
jgi:hypothetical protein